MRWIAPPPPPGKNDQARFFRLDEDNGIKLNDALVQKPLAKACEKWIEKKVEIRTVKHAGFLHGKLYHVTSKGSNAALLGSSNFTRRGLGYGAIPNIELNLEVREEADRKLLADWFDELWNDSDLTEDVKNDVLAALKRLGRPYPPQFVYYKTLFHVFADWIERQKSQDDLIADIHLHDTEIWKRLYQFQKDGVVSAINRLIRHNGCIVADSVGLGKTWTALAVIKFFEQRGDRVLVLCPKRLEENWTRYTARANQKNNPFEKDRLNYTVLAHTDLSRYEGKSGDIDFAKFKWSAFDFIVIDESHNFRNEGRDRRDEAGNVIRRSRYNRLLDDVIKDGVHTKLLMLSATPVNTSLRDLRNQIYLMTEKRQDAFRETHGISNLQTMFRVAQGTFQKWEKERKSNDVAPDKGALIERLGADFLGLLDAVTIARSRDHLRRFYAKQTEEELGGFPKRAAPENRYPQTDSKGELSYNELHRQISDFGLAVYTPSAYLKTPPDPEEERSHPLEDQRLRENWLINMLRTNLLKRLESSAHAFTLTVERILEKINEILEKMDRFENEHVDGDIDNSLYEDEEDEEYAKEFTVGKKLSYKLSELDIDRWRKDLCEDKELFEDIYRRAQQVDAERDAKLAELKEQLERKVKSAPKDKDGHPNSKALIFTTFTDTAEYLYENLKDWLGEELNIKAALVTGSSGNRSTTDTTNFIEILGRFAPKAQNFDAGRDEIDVLIATDCLSEGQNLQDCDLVVNYDIHWNPVRLLQRFGRIDRLRSRNHEVRMVNFWPTENLNRYLDLTGRVEARMALADAAATGDDDLLNTDVVQSELNIRVKQLEKFRDGEIVDVEDADGSITMSDLTLDNFVADLLQYLQNNREELEAAPFGINAIIAGSVDSKEAPPGVIFCLKRKGEPKERTPNRLWPYFLVYVRNDGTVHYAFQQAQKCLMLFQKLAARQPQVVRALENAFDQETQHGKCMDKYNALLDTALKNIDKTLRAAQIKSIAIDPDAKILEQVSDDDNIFELVTWLVIADRHPHP